MNKLFSEKIKNNLDNAAIIKSHMHVGEVKAGTNIL